MNKFFVSTCLLLVVIICGNAQENHKISTMDFVQILDGNRDETVHYYQNNWKVLRERAIDQNYIHSYEVLETSFSSEAPFHLILITTYMNKAQYDLREEHFSELIEQHGDLNLLNHKKPNEFRKTVFNKEGAKHWKK